MDFIGQYEEMVDLIADHLDVLDTTEQYITELGKNKVSAEKSMTDLERQIIRNAGGYDALGSNEGKRKERRAELLDASQAYTSASRSLDLICADLADKEAEQKRLLRRYQFALHRMDAIAALAINATGAKHGGLNHDADPNY